MSINRQTDSPAAVALPLYPKKRFESARDGWTIMRPPAAKMRMMGESSKLNGGKYNT